MVVVADTAAILREREREREGERERGREIESVPPTLPQNTE